MPVSYVIGDVAGEVESPVYAILDMNKSLSENRHEPVRRKRTAIAGAQCLDADDNIGAGAEVGWRVAHYD